MQRFLVRVFAFGGLVLGSILLVFLQADGHSDPFYLKFTTPQQQSLILGTSRAAQGLRPDVLNATLGRTDLYNFSFTLAHSPFGPVYLSSIQNKLDPKAREGLFILEVNPWSISSKGKAPNDTTRFRERQGALACTPWVATDPNIPYLIWGFDGPYLELLQKDSSLHLHANGWLEVSVPMDSLQVARRRARKVRSYQRDIFPHYQFSSTRLEYLERTISLLRKHGRVFLVRLPVHKDMLVLEDAYMPDFLSKIDRAIHLSDGYLDLTGLPQRLPFTDGHHLHKSSAGTVSRLLGAWIEEQGLP